MQKLLKHFPVRTLYPSMVALVEPRGLEVVNRVVQLDGLDAQAANRIRRGLFCDMSTNSLDPVSMAYVVSGSKCWALEP
jgi:hypothetical protein